jgi:hypothetical protein
MNNVISFTLKLCYPRITETAFGAKHLLKANIAINGQIIGQVINGNGLYYITA